MLMQYIGLELDSNLTDFEDGELKTNKADRNGNPLETMWITQISERIDDYLSVPPKDFKQTALYHKIKSLVFLPICKSAENPGDWFFTSCHYLYLPDDPFMATCLERDYRRVCGLLRNHIEDGHDGMIHTSSAQFIQVRSKDNKPYNPIWSNLYGQMVSNKNHGFYFKKEFMQYVIRQPAFSAV